MWFVWRCRRGLRGLCGGGGGPAPAQDPGRERGGQHPLHRVRNRIPAPVGPGFQPRSRCPVHARRFRASGYVLLLGRGRRNVHLAVAVRRHCPARQEPRPPLPRPCFRTPSGAAARLGGEACKPAAICVASDRAGNCASGCAGNGRAPGTPNGSPGDCPAGRQIIRPGAEGGLRQLACGKGTGPATRPKPPVKPPAAKAPARTATRR